MHVGPLRVAAIAAASPVIQDALVAGQDKPFVALLAWPNLHACRQLAGKPEATLDDLMRDPDVLRLRCARALRRTTPRRPAAASASHACC